VHNNVYDIIIWFIGVAILNLISRSTILLRGRGVVDPNKIAPIWNYERNELYMSVNGPLDTCMRTCVCVCVCMCSIIFYVRYFPYGDACTSVQQINHIIIIIISYNSRRERVPPSIPSVRVYWFLLLMISIIPIIIVTRVHAFYTIAFPSVTRSVYLFSRQYRIHRFTIHPVDYIGFFSKIYNNCILTMWCICKHLKQHLL